MKYEFQIHGGGDRSVGLWDTHAHVVIEDNSMDDETQEWKQVLADMYDIPPTAIMTQAEYDKELALADKEEAERFRMEQEIEPTIDETREFQQTKEESEGMGAQSSLVFGNKPELKWPYDTPEKKEKATQLLRDAGCKCEQPLLGYRPGVGPRCRLCNTVAESERE